jgi:hypothetical protein
MFARSETREIARMKGLLGVLPVAGTTGRGVPGISLGTPRVSDTPCPNQFSGQLAQMLQWPALSDFLTR